LGIADWGWRIGMADCGCLMWDGGCGMADVGCGIADWGWRMADVIFALCSDAARLGFTLE